MSIWKSSGYLGRPRLSVSGSLPYRVIFSGALAEGRLANVHMLVTSNQEAPMLDGIGFAIGLILIGLGIPLIAQLIH